MAFADALDAAGGVGQFQRTVHRPLELADLFLNHYNIGGDTIWWGTTRSGFSTTPVGFTSTATLTAGYQYGTDGLRSAKTVNGAATTFAWDTAGGLPLLLSQTTGTATSYLVYGPGGAPIFQYDPDGTIAYLHLDQLGSVRLVTDTTGAAVGTVTYDAYGRTTTDTTPAANKPLLGYASQYLDQETGHHYLRNRYYDPTTSQFLTRDPAVSVTHEPYGYAANDPVNNTDPTGLYCLTGKNPNGSCRSISRGASGVGRVALEATGDIVAATPSGRALSMVSRWTGYTLGLCLNGNIFGGLALDGSLCYQATPTGESGFSITTGGGLGFPAGGSVSGSFQVSNARKMSDLSGVFGYVTGSAGEGPVGTADTSFGLNQCGVPIWTFGIGAGTRGDAPVPYGFTGGESHTWVF